MHINRFKCRLHRQLNILTGFARINQVENFLFGVQKNKIEAACYVNKLLPVPKLFEKSPVNRP